MQSIDDMTDSVERQKIHRLAKLEGKVEGFLQGSRLILVVPGAEKFGPPTSATLKRIDYIRDPGELRRMAVRFVRASGWDGTFRA